MLQLTPAPTVIPNEVEFFEVTRSVNKVQKSKGVPNDGPELIEPS